MLEELSKHQDTWLRMALKICGNKNQAQDLVQDMYLKMHEKQFEVKEVFVYFVLKNLFIDQKRSLKVRDVKELQPIHELKAFCEDINFDSIANSENEFDCAIEVFNSLNWHEQYIIKECCTISMREFSRQSKIAMPAIININRNYRQKVWELQKRKSKDLEMLSQRLQEQWESNHVQGVKSEGDRLTPYFLFTGL